MPDLMMMLESIGAQRGERYARKFRQEEKRSVVAPNAPKSASLATSGQRKQINRIKRICHHHGNNRDGFNPSASNRMLIGKHSRFGKM